MHHCGSDGHWDMNPGVKSCQMITCPNPVSIWSQWLWSCPNNIHLPGQNCKGSCSLKEGVEVTIECSNEGIWKVSDEISLQDSCNNCLGGWKTQGKPVLNFSISIFKGESGVHEN